MKSKDAMRKLRKVTYVVVAFIGIYNNPFLGGASTLCILAIGHPIFQLNGTPFILLILLLEWMFRLPLVGLSWIKS